MLDDLQRRLTNGDDLCGLDQQGAAPVSKIYISKLGYTIWACGKLVKSWLNKLLLKTPFECLTNISTLDTHYLRILFNFLFPILDQHKMLSCSVSPSIMALWSKPKWKCDPLSAPLLLTRSGNTSFFIDSHIKNSRAWWTLLGCFGGYCDHIFP